MSPASREEFGIQLRALHESCTKILGSTLGNEFANADFISLDQNRQIRLNSFDTPNGQPGHRDIDYYWLGDIATNPDFLNWFFDNAKPKASHPGYPWKILWRALNDYIPENKKYTPQEFLEVLEEFKKTHQQAVKAAIFDETELVDRLHNKGKWMAAGGAAITAGLLGASAYGYHKLSISQTREKFADKALKSAYKQATVKNPAFYNIPLEDLHDYDKVRAALGKTEAPDAQQSLLYIEMPGQGVIAVMDSKSDYLKAFSTLHEIREHYRKPGASR